MLDKRIKFDERWDREDGNTELFFIAPKDMLNGKYPEAESMEIMVECPTEYISANYANVEFSPTKYDEEEEAYTDYDWNAMNITFEEIEALIKLAEESGRM